MAPPSIQTLQRAAAVTGYSLDTLEKVARLLDMLAGINADPLLAGRLALKGGTALNVFHLNLDRLSVDIDLNYIGALDPAAMQKERPDIDDAIARIFASKGYSVRRRPEEHGGGKWVSRYASALGGNAAMEVDVNYMYRQPLFDTARIESADLGGIRASNILVLDIHEIIAGKLVALFDRRAVRDLFDAQRILSIEGLDWKRIKTAVLAFGACRRFDWRDVSIKDVTTPEDSRQKLLYCLPQDHPLNGKNYDTWVQDAISVCQQHFSFLFDLSMGERAFLDGVLDHGEINPHLLDNTEPDTQTRIGAMPMLAWKAMHVRKHRHGNDPTPTAGIPEPI